MPVLPPLRTPMAVGYYLAGPKCKPNSCQKVYYSSRPKYYFLSVNRGTASKILKTCFGLSEQV